MSDMSLSLSAQGIPVVGIQGVLDVQRACGLAQPVFAGPDRSWVSFDARGHDPEYISYLDQEELIGDGSVTLLQAPMTAVPGVAALHARRALWLHSGSLQTVPFVEHETADGKFRIALIDRTEALNRLRGVCLEQVGQAEDHLADALKIELQGQRTSKLDFNATLENAREAAEAALDAAFGRKDLEWEAYVLVGAVLVTGKRRTALTRRLIFVESRFPDLDREDFFAAVHLKLEVLRAVPVVASESPTREVMTSARRRCPGYVALVRQFRNNLRGLVQERPSKARELATQARECWGELQVDQQRQAQEDLAKACVALQYVHMTQAMVLLVLSEPDLAFASAVEQLFRVIEPDDGLAPGVQADRAATVQMHSSVFRDWLYRAEKSGIVGGSHELLAVLRRLDEELVEATQ